MRSLKKDIICLVIALVVVTIICTVLLYKIPNKSNIYSIDLANLTAIKKYLKDDFNDFKAKYEDGKLDNVYITEFIFDGVDMYKDYDLDDFIDKGNDYEAKVIKTNVVNIHEAGEYRLTGSFTGSLFINTNDLDGDIKIILDNVNIDSGNKKVPAIYVYNKDTNYTKHKVTISTLNDTNNYITGGKLKKVSLVPKDNLEDYVSYYSGGSKSNYLEYTNYYGIYNKNELKNILFATLKADKEDLASGDPYYYYKASGAISSDIDLTFEGEGSLNVASAKDEGIESKGNLEFIGGTGDYFITSYDDALNTTLENGRNSILIDVKSLIALVNLESEEGDAIDSNGTLTINEGYIIALSKPGKDSGLDSTLGTIINGGTIIATGDMYDEIKSSSKQKTLVLSFDQSVDNLITLLDKDNNLVFAYMFDRSFSTLVFSSDLLKNETYTLYSGGILAGESKYGLYLEGDYTLGSMLGYTTTSVGKLGMHGSGNSEINYTYTLNNTINTFGQIR